MAKSTTVQHEIHNPSTTRDAVTYLKAGIKKGSTIFWIPANFIQEIAITEDMHKLFPEGILKFYDTGRVITQKFGITGQEKLLLGIGGNVDNRFDFEAELLSVDSVDGDYRGALVSISFEHASHEGSHVATAASYSGKLSDVMKSIGESLCIEADFNITETMNSGKYVNPGYKKKDFIDYLKRIALSVDGLSSYIATVTRTKFHFVPRDYFNKLKIAKDNIFRDIPNISDYKKTILGSTFEPVNGQFESIGMSSRDMVVFDFDRGFEKINFNIDDIIPKKTFTGKYIPSIPRVTLPNMPRMNEYHGFRDVNDAKGYVTGRSERMLERVSTGEIVIPGKATLEPGDPIRIDIKSYDDADEPRESYYSGKWIIEKVTHSVSPQTGFVSYVRVARNAIPDISDELLLKKAPNVRAD